MNIFRRITPDEVKWKEDQEAMRRHFTKYLGEVLAGEHRLTAKDVEEKAEEMGIPWDLELQ